MFSIDLSKYVAPPQPVQDPTVGWYVNNQKVSGQAIQKQTGEPFTLEFRSTDAVWCDLTTTLNGSPWYTSDTSQGLGTSFSWGTERLTSNAAHRLYYSVTCRNSNNVSATAYLYLYELNPNVVMTDGWSTLPRYHTRYMSQGQKFGLAFHGNNVNYCSLNAYHNGVFWYSSNTNAGLGTSFSWGSNNVWNEAAGTTIKWQVTCQNAYGYSDTNYTSISTR